jgi:glycosyltransferase involved in cell wall biosynthesis
LGLKEAVRFIGQQPHDPQIFTSAEIFVMSSSREGHPLALLEAMATGLPVLATRVGGIPEILGAGDDCGFMVASNDVLAMAGAMKQILETPAEKLLAMGKRASEKIRKNFSHQNYLSKIGGLYEEILP